MLNFQGEVHLFHVPCFCKDFCYFTNVHGVKVILPVVLLAEFFICKAERVKFLGVKLVAENYKA